ncbi:hypothetical protein EJ04DRAFT_516765 [Polyplosphaeria fusca]|uniref:Uncharacterized protein n=1 Tax=Polyplosphaeria fusca TaxID=682080 RepID=A0A9P4QNW6_9PLEO|nr:hypothetical protein EJ04DRAFT_516765 [Polyplosphaeria fusca]
MFTNYTTISSPRSSMDTTKAGSTSSTSSLTKHTESSNKDSGMKKVWQSIKKHAKEHHESVNAAYEVYYGQGRMHSNQDWNTIKRQG